MHLMISHEAWGKKEYSLLQNEIVSYAATVIDPYPVQWNEDAPEKGKECYMMHCMAYELGIKIRQKYKRRK